MYIELKDWNCVFKVIFLVNVEARPSKNLSNESFPSYAEGSDRNQSKHHGSLLLWCLWALWSWWHLLTSHTFNKYCPPKIWIKMPIIPDGEDKPKRVEMRPLEKFSGVIWIKVLFISCMENRMTSPLISTLKTVLKVVSIPNYFSFSSLL